MGNVILNNSSNCTNMNKILTNTTCLKADQIQAYLKEELNEDQRFDVENQLPVRKNWAMRIAASLLLLSIPIGSYLYWQSTETERILAANFMEEDNPVIGALRSGDNSLITNTTLQNGLEAYQNQQFDISLNILTKVLNTDPENVELIFRIITTRQPGN